MIYFGAYKGSHDWGSYNCNIINVTHWMPIPTLPSITCFPTGRYVYMSKEELKVIYPDKNDTHEMD